MSARQAHQMLDSRGRERGLEHFGPLGGILTAAIWVLAAVVELRMGQISHSLVARPERLLGDETQLLRPVLVLLVLAAAITWTLFVVVLTEDSGHVWLRRVAVVVASVAAAAGFVTVFASPAHAALDEISPIRTRAALLALVAVPLAIALVGATIRDKASPLAWLSGLFVLLTVWSAIWATTWSAVAGSAQPQLWAFTPVEALAALWAAAGGAWTLAQRHRHSWSGLLYVPPPGRKALSAFAIAALAVGYLTSASFIRGNSTIIMAQLTGRTSVETMHVDIDRTYRVYRPTKELENPGLVVALHPVFGSGFKMESYSGFDVQADRLGWVVVYPDGILDGWEAFGSGPTWGHHEGVDDVAFIRDLIAHFEKTDAVDPARVYVTGFSRGAMMTYRMGCELSSVVAAVAPVSGNMATAEGSADVPCQPEHPVSILAIHGTADGSIPFNGGRTDIVYSPFSDVMAKWRSWDGCPSQGQQTQDGASTTSSWSCSRGTTVTMRVVAGGCHCWPQSSGAETPTNPDDFDAARLIADFFVSHPKPADS